VIVWAKVGGILLAVALCFAGGWYCGSLRSKTAYEALQAAQAENTAKAVLAERASTAAELARTSAILKGYQDAPIDSVALSVGSRVFKYANAASCSLPQAAADPGRAPSAAPLPVGPSEVERALADLAVACSEDARELAALQAAWPR